MITGSRLHQRKGVSTVQYCTVLLICVCIATSAAFILSKSFSQLDEIAHLVPHPSTHQPKELSDPSPVIELQAEQTAAISSELVEMNNFITISTMIILGLSFLYLRQGKRKRMDEEHLSCHIDLLAKRNLALETVLGKRQRIHNQIRLEGFSMDTGRVVDIMSTDVSTIKPNLEVQEAGKMLTDAGFRRTIVVDQENNLMGVLSKKDISSKSGKIVAQVMTSDPKTATPDMTIKVALTILLQNRISCLPVVKGEKFVGLVSTSDMLIYLQCLLSASPCSSGEAVVSS